MATLPQARNTTYAAAAPSPARSGQCGFYSNATVNPINGTTLMVATLLNNLGGAENGQGSATETVSASSGQVRASSSLVSLTALVPEVRVYANNWITFQADQSCTASNFYLQLQNADGSGPPLLLAGSNAGNITAVTYTPTFVDMGRGSCVQYAGNSQNCKVYAEQWGVNVDFSLTTSSFLSADTFQYTPNGVIGIQ